MTHPSEQAEPAILLTACEIQEHFGIPPSTIRTWVDRGHLTPVGRQGRTALFAMSDVQRARHKAKRKPTRREDRPLLGT